MASMVSRMLRDFQPRKALRGLFGTQKILKGNSVTFSNHRTIKLSYPNAVKMSFHSEILGEVIRCRATTRVLRTIDKVGGFDRYILTMPARKVNSDLAADLKVRMLARLIKTKTPVPERLMVRAKPPASQRQAAVKPESAPASAPTSAQTEKLPSRTHV
eukprot:Opistho-1_new@93561